MLKEHSCQALGGGEDACHRKPAIPSSASRCTLATRQSDAAWPTISSFRRSQEFAAFAINCSDLTGIQLD